MKAKYQVQVTASLTKCFDIEADNKHEAKSIAEKRMAAEFVCERTSAGGSWDVLEKYVEQVLNKEG